MALGDSDDNNSTPKISPPPSFLNEGVAKGALLSKVSPHIYAAVATCSYVSKKYIEGVLCKRRD